MGRRILTRMVVLSFRRGEMMAVMEGVRKGAIRRGPRGRGGRRGRPHHPHHPRTTLNRAPMTTARRTLTMWILVRMLTAARMIQLLQALKMGVGRAAGRTQRVMGKKGRGRGRSPGGMARAAAAHLRRHATETTRRTPTSRTTIPRTSGGIRTDSACRMGGRCRWMCRRRGRTEEGFEQIGGREWCVGREDEGVFPSSVAVSGHSMCWREREVGVHRRRGREQGDVGREQDQWPCASNCVFYVHHGIGREERGGGAEGGNMSGADVICLLGLESLFASRVGGLGKLSAFHKAAAAICVFPTFYICAREQWCSVLLSK